MWNFDKIKNYWESRAKEDGSVQSTTNDVYLREIETRVLGDFILKLSPETVADIGCGDGCTTIATALKLPSVKFWGFDYAESMIRNANRNLSETGLENVSFEVGDITDSVKGNYDLIYTTRCLINLPQRRLQINAIHNI